MGGFDQERVIEAGRGEERRKEGDDEGQCQAICSAHYEKQFQAVHSCELNTKPEWRCPDAVDESAGIALVAEPIDAEHAGANDAATVV